MKMKPEMVLLVFSGEFHHIQVKQEEHQKSQLLTLQVSSLILWCIWIFIALSMIFVMVYYHSHEYEQSVVIQFVCEGMKDKSRK